YRVLETFSDEILMKMNTSKLDYPIATNNTMINHDVFLFGIPTCFGTMPTHMEAFWNATGDLWHNYQLGAKYAGMFVSTLAHCGGQQSTIISFIFTLAHHSIIYIPLRYKASYGNLISENEVHGGKVPCRAGTFSGLDGLCTPMELEIKIAEMQGKTFYAAISQVD
ncbi:hypothetical protein BYT27DRAFT_7091776, partial [Phlegmacium glaucopus]